MKNFKIIGMILVGICVLYTFFCRISTPEYELIIHDTDDDYSTNLMKKDFSESGICRWMEDVFVPYDGCVFVVYHTSSLFDNHFQPGLILVLINDRPQYTLEINSIYSKSIEFQGNQMYITKQYDPYTRIYTLEGEYIGKESKREILYSKNKIATTDKCKYEIKMIGLSEAVVKTDSNGTESILYKSPGVFTIKYILFYCALAVGVVCIVLSLLLSHRMSFNKKHA